MRKFIFSLKSLAMTLALVVGGSAWAQITSLPFVADFSGGPAPFGEPAFKTGTAAIGDVVAVTGGTAEATFAVGGGAYALGNAEEVTVSFTMFNGWLGNGLDNTFAVLNSDGVALASISYNANNCNIVDVKLGGSTVEGFEAFAGQGNYNGSKGSNGYTHSQTYVANTDEAKNNGEVTIKINSYGGLSLAFVGGKGNVDKYFSATAPAGTKIDLAKLTISNGSTNADRASGYGNLTVSSKSMVKYSNDYSDEVVTWTSATGGRYTPVILDDAGNKYLSVNQDERNNNGTTITSTETEGKVAAGEDFTMSFRVKLGASTDQTATAFNIYDAANSATILKFAEVVKNATAWTINDGTQTATVSAGGGKAIADLAWIDVKVTSIAGGKTYLTLKDADGDIIDNFDKTLIPTLSTTGGLGKMQFPTSRYNANFAIDDIVVRDVVESEDIPSTPVYNYTVKFVDQNGDEFKDASVREEYDGVELAILDEDKETVVVGQSQYTYVSDDAEGKTAASDGSTVITVTFNKITVSNYVVNYIDAEGNPLKDATTHKNVVVGTEVTATAGELSKILVDGVIYNYASGNDQIAVAEDASANVINLIFAPVDGVTGYFFNSYENRAVDWTTATGGRYSPVVVDGSTIGDRATTVLQPKIDPNTGEPVTDPETGEPVYENVPGISIPFANKTYFLTVNQAERNNNGVTNGVSSASLAVDQADFTLETKIILGTSNNQGCSFQIKNLAGDANILQLIPTAVGSTTWVVNGDAEKFAVELPGTGNFGGTGNDNLSNYSWYDLKVTVYNGVTFVTIADEAGTKILDKAQVPTLATTYGLGTMIFYTGRYNSNFGIDDVLVRSVVESEDVPASAEFVAVKINYVDEAKNVLKPADEVKFQVGQPIVLNSAFTADFKVDAEGNVWTAESESAPVTKYIYVSDNSADVTAALDAQVNIVFRGVASRRLALRYQIQKVDGSIVTKDAAGTNLSFFYDSNKTGDVLFEKDILTVYYPYYLLVDGLLYKTAANGGGTDKVELEIEPGTGTQTKTPVTWTPAMETVPVIDPETQEPVIDPETQEPVTEEVQISNAVFAQETENIEGITVVKDGYTQIRMANGAAGSAIGGDVLVTTLEPGKYSLTTATRSGTTNFTVGGEVVATISSSGTTTTTTTEFTVNQTSPLYIQEQSGTTQYSDYVLIRKLEAAESYEIAVADDIENGTVEVPATAAAGAVVKPVLTPDTDFKAGTITVITTSGTPVEVADGAFTMPAEAVVVSAIFIAKQTTKPVPAFSELADDGETIQYIYNVEAGAFLLGANDWGTRASADEAKGYQFKVQKNADGTTWTLNDYVENQSAWKAVFAENPSSVWVDNLSGANVAAWEIKALGENKYEITNPAAVADGKLAVAPSLNDSRLYLVDDSRFGTTWAFVSEADYAKYQAEYAAWLEYVPELKQSTKYGQDITPAVGRIATSMDGWTIDNESTFHINTWSWEGLTDGSWMTPSFLENWVGAGSLLPEGTWTYTISGLVPGQSYDVSALVRAYNEGSTDIPTGAYLYAGEGKSEDISTGTANVDTKASVYATLAATGAADADGNLKIGIVEKENNFNWIVARDFKVSVSIPKFDITVAPVENGAIEVPANAAPGETVAIVAAPAEGYELASVMITGVNTNIAVPVDVDEWTGELSFTMPEDDVTVTATFQEAYVKLSDYAVTVNPEFVYDAEFGDEIVATITYSSEIVGSYAESFLLNAQFDYEVKDASGNVVATGTKNPLNVSDNSVIAYIDGLAANTTYTINITGVEVTDFDLATFEDVVVFKEVIGLDGKPLATATFTTGLPTGIEAAPAAEEGVKADGKYFENGKIVIYKNGNKYDVSGAPLNK